MSMNKVQSSDLKSVSSIINAAPCGLTGISAFTNGTNAATLTIYDNASSATGKVLAQLAFPGANLGGYQSFPTNVQAVNGLYASVSGIGATFIIHYEP